MKQRIAVCAIALAIGLLAFSTAFAEEQDTFEPEWDGAYGGAVLGISKLKTTTTDVKGNSVYPGYKYDFDNSGVVGGLLAGYNWSFDHWVTGVEADFSFGDIQTSSMGFDPLQRDQDAVSKVHWLSTLRARAGYSFGRFLPYLTGGVAYADVTDKNIDYDAGVYDPRDSCTNRETRLGWVVGGGAEYQLSEFWMLRFEGMYVDLGEIEMKSPAGWDVFRQKSTVTTLRFGLIYNF